MNQLQTTTLTGQNISNALLTATYTATACRGLVISVCSGSIAGNGNYQAYVTRQISGSGIAYPTAITTDAVPTGVTSHLFNSIEIPVDLNDVVKVYIVGLAGDTTNPYIITNFYEHDYVRPTVIGRTLDIAATGEVGLDFTNILQASSPTTMTNLTIPTVINLTNANPSASSIDTQLISTHGSGNWTSGSAPSVAQIRTEMDTNSTKLVNLDATISSRFSGSSFIGPVSASSIDTQLISSHGSGAWTSGSAPSVVDIRTEMDNNSTKLAKLDATISSRVSGSSYIPPVAPPTVGQIDTQLTSTHGSGNWNGSGGGGGSSAADIWSYASRTLTQAIDGSTSSIITGSSITFYSYATNYASVTSVPDDDEIWFTVKKNIMQPDSESIIQISKTGGLLYLNGNIASSSSDGSLIVTDGTANIILTAEASPLAFGNSVAFTGEIKTRTSGSVVAVVTQFPVIIRPLITKTI